MTVAVIYIIMTVITFLILFFVDYAEEYKGIKIVIEGIKIKKVKLEPKHQYNIHESVLYGISLGIFWPFIFIVGLYNLTIHLIKTWFDYILNDIEEDKTV
jgi:fucose permease